ncbi:MAG: HAD family hydrolase [Chloroflexia bacterium]|nr:HAD family hydrolase [Chloroflexia bacterium]
MGSTNRQHLIFDADDTLWENNIHFERAIEAFIDFVDHAHLDRAEVRAVLDEIEHANLTVHGYGARAFAQNLRLTFRQLSECEEDDPHLDTVERLGLGILTQELELIAGVPETLDRLRLHHTLYLLTKGQEEEQRLKIERSGLVDRFADAIIVAEKTPAAYHEIVQRFGLDSSLTWMIGNSPRSDINPALAAGINAVFIPHAATWRLEHEHLASPPESGRLVEIAAFPELERIFLPREATFGAR